MLGTPAGLGLAGTTAALRTGRAPGTLALRVGSGIAALPVLGIAGEVGIAAGSVPESAVEVRIVAVLGPGTAVEVGIALGSGRGGSLRTYPAAAVPGSGMGEFLQTDYDPAEEVGTALGSGMGDSLRTYPDSGMLPGGVPDPGMLPGGVLDPGMLPGGVLDPGTGILGFGIHHSPARTADRHSDSGPPPPTRAHGPGTDPERFPGPDEVWARGRG